MLETLNKKYPFNDILRTNIRSIVSISLGVFLFLLFFQPLNTQNPDFNNKLIILATFGAITLVLLSMFRIIVPSIFTRTFSNEKWTLKKEILINLLFVIFNSVAFSFFARYVGKIPITFHIAIMIVIISICSAITLVVINEFQFLKMQLKEALSSDYEVPEEPTTESISEIEFISENKSEYFHLFPEQIILIKSANNYIEIIYKQGDRTSRRLIRNTLKNTELITSKYSNLLRCHRSYIINKDFIKDVSRGTDGLLLTMFDYPGKIQVSRQYVITIKEALKTG